MPAVRTRETHSAARPLEVSTSAPPPSLAIISPTPRAFAFPISHNLSDSPYSSPSNSPFDPDLLALALPSSPSPSSSVSSRNDECLTPPPLSAFTPPLSLAWAATPPSHASAPIRRKSTSSAVEERRPKRGDNDYVKRPENAFILFRRKCCEDRAFGLPSLSTSAASGPSSADSPSLATNAAAKKPRQADLSKTISQQWKALSPEERAHWEALAKVKKREHETLHPSYVYRPQRRPNASAAAGSLSSTTTQRRKHSVPPSQQVEFVVPTPRAQRSPSAGASTPPPYQAIQIPSVYLGSSSGPFSADGGGESPTSLVSMISRRGLGNGNGGFDYLPSFQGAFDFEASLESSDFLRSMFQTLSPTSPQSASAGGILSPVSSASSSGPSSPYTPASASFHPSAFSSSYTARSAFSPPVGTADTSDNAPRDIGHVLEAPSCEPAISTGMEPDYSSYASAWMASSPWASDTTGGGLAEGDFDIGRIPEIGWELSCAALPGSDFAAPYDGGEMHGFGEQSMPGEPRELDIHFGEMGEMGFDEMMAGLRS
ncbi:hypothetical protein DFH07DRAFT_15187 [Mycena maculata]|uniref:HMG box domain-containing protein n=1 Tax=Mycena maculata TaxID=230809 RepID=A0AAD7N408_9AGAR|nr:hypothetical protein DFH07DRAFT_15187 [Mycena maculata]